MLVLFKNWLVNWLVGCLFIAIPTTFDFMVLNLYHNLKWNPRVWLFMVANGDVWLLVANDA